MPTETAPNATAVAPPAHINSEIDKLLALSSTRHQTSVQGNPGTLEVRVTPGEAPKITVHEPPTPSTADAARLHDNGVVISSEVEKLQTTLKLAESNLVAIKGYDPATGEAVPVYPPGSPERAMAESHLQRLRTSVAFSLQQFNRLQAQRDADAAKVNAADRERTLVDAFSRGDPTRAERLKAALADAEAAEVAAAIIAGRRGGR